MRSRAVHIFGLVLLAAAATWWLLHDGSREDAAPLDRAEHEGERADPRTEAPSLQGLPPAEVSEAPPEEPTEPRITRRLVGRVVDVSRAPVHGAMVWLGADAEPPFPAGFTDAEGTFRLDAAQSFPTGTHLLGARHHDGRCAYTHLAVPAGAFEMDVGELVLQEGETIRGTVVDEKGEPLEHVRVRAQAEAGLVVEMFHAGHRRMIGTGDVLTDAKGEFVLKGLAPVGHGVFVDLTLRNGVTVTPERVRGARPGDPSLRFTVKKTRVVTGRVVDGATGDPIQEFNVNGIPHQDAEGRFEVGVPVRRMVVVAARGYQVWTGETDDRSKLAVRLVRLSDPGSLRITVQDGAGGGLTGWRAVLTGPEFVVWQIESKDRKEVVVEGLRDGIYDVQVSAPGRSLHLANPIVEPHRQSAILVTLHRGGVVHLDVRDEDGEGVSGVEVSLHDPEGEEVAARWRYDEPQGTLIWVTEMTLTGRTRLQRLLGRIDGLRAGRYVLRIHRAVGHRDVEIEVPVEGEVEQKVRLGEK